MPATAENNPSWLDRPIFTKLTLNIETLLWILIFFLAVFSRFYILGARVMSHDENSHVYYSWRFANGQGFAHDPLMHGPLQFHLIALSYFMFGDNDFTARAPAALFSVAAIGFLWFCRRYLGRSGALVGATLMLISPYMLYYGRYARNEGLIELFGVVTIWAILRYLETGWPRYLYWLTLATVLHFTAKETSFIYTAQAMLFLGGYFIYKITQLRWPRTEYRNRFLFTLIIALLLFAALGGYLVLSGRGEASVATTPSNSTEVASTLVPPAAPSPIAATLAALFGLVVVVGLSFLIRGYTLEGLRADRAFGALLVLATLVLPQLAAFPVRWMGWKIPTNASEVMALDLTGILHVAVFLTPLAILSVIIGLIWNHRLWLINAAIWYGVFTLFYTSIFTNGAGFFTGMVGSLGYWLEQQSVERGNQPWYYYALVQVPVYEYLVALGTVLAFVIAFADMFRRKETKAERGEIASLEAGQADENGGDALADREYAASLSAEDDSLLSPSGVDQVVEYGGNYGADYSPADEDLVDQQPQPASGRFPAPGDLQSAPVFPLLGFHQPDCLFRRRREDALADRAYRSACHPVYRLGVGAADRRHELEPVTGTTRLADPDLDPGISLELFRRPWRSARSQPTFPGPATRPAPGNQHFFAQLSVRSRQRHRITLPRPDLAGHPIHPPGNARLLRDALGINCPHCHPGQLLQLRLRKRAAGLRPLSAWR